MKRSAFPIVRRVGPVRMCRAPQGPDESAEGLGSVAGSVVSPLDPCAALPKPGDDALQEADRVRAFSSARSFAQATRLAPSMRTCSYSHLTPKSNRGKELGTHGGAGT